MERRLEPEVMDVPEEIAAYAEADFRASNATYVRRAVDHLDVVLATTRSPIVLDLGCGPGDITLAFAQARPHWQFVGVDASAPMLAIARKRAEEARVANIRFELADVKGLPSPAEPYCAAVSNSLLHHLPDPAALWRSLRRVLRPGAAVFIRDLRRPDSDPAAREIVERHAGGASPLLKDEFYRSLLAAFTAEEVAAQLRSAGYYHVQVSEVDDRYLELTATTP